MESAVTEGVTVANAVTLGVPECVRLRLEVPVPVLVEETVTVSEGLLDTGGDSELVREPVWVGVAVFVTRVLCVTVAVGVEESVIEGVAGELGLGLAVNDDVIVSVGVGVLDQGLGVWLTEAVRLAVVVRLAVIEEVRVLV